MNPTNLSPQFHKSHIMPGFYLGLLQEFRGTGKNGQKLLGTREHKGNKAGNTGAEAVSLIYEGTRNTKIDKNTFSTRDPWKALHNLVRCRATSMATKHYSLL